MARTRIRPPIAAGRCQLVNVLLPARRKVPASVEGVANASGSTRAARQLNHNSSAGEVQDEIDQGHGSVMRE